MLLSPIMNGFRKRSIEMEALSDTEQSKIREFTVNISAYLDGTSRRKFSTLIAQYLSNTIKLNSLITEVRHLPSSSLYPS